MADVGDKIKSYDFQLHFYADGGQIYLSCFPPDADLPQIQNTEVLHNQAIIALLTAPQT